MAFSRINHQIEGLKETLFAYVNAKIEYLELTLVKKVSETAAKAIKGVMAAFFFFLFLVLLSVAVAIYIGEMMHEMSYGFFIVAGFYLFLLLLVLLFAKGYFQRKIIKSLSGKLAEMEKKRKSKKS